MANNADNRPVSADLIDLHIFVVPIQSWLGKYSVAYNNVALQSTSAGFIRVYSDAVLQVIRETIEDQLGSDIIPEEYVFLRSVGRCLAIVNQTQEKSLKAKHFLPPVAFSPEIFILPGSHEWIASLRKKTKSIVVNGEIPLQDEYRLKSGDSYRREISDDYPLSEQFSDGGSGNANRFNMGLQPVQHSREKEMEDVAPLKGRTPETETDNGDGDRSEMLLQKADTRQNRKHFSDIVKAGKKKAEREGYTLKSGNGYSDRERKASDKQTNAKYFEIDDNIERSMQDYRNRNADEFEYMTGNEGIAVQPERQNQLSTRSPRDDLAREDNLRAGKNERGSGENIDIMLDGGKDQRSNRNNGYITKGREEEPNGIGREQGPARNRSETFPRARPAIQVLHPEMITTPSTPYTMSRATPIPSANVIHSTLTMDSYERPSESKSMRDVAVRAPDELTIPPKPDEEQDIGTPEKGTYESTLEKDINESTPEKDTYESTPEKDTNERDDHLQVNNRYAKSGRSSSQRGLSVEEVKRREEEKRRLEEERVKMDEKKKNMENDTMQMMKDMEDLLRQKKEEEEKRRLEEEKRKKEEKERMEQKKIEAFNLRDQLLKIRDERLQRQKEREGLMKIARELKGKIAEKRSVEPSVWEKKYLAEKERSLKLEEELKLLKSELGASQQKLLKIFENKDSDVHIEQKSPRTVSGPSQLNNLKNEVRKIKKERESVESDIERTKKKLNIESQQKAAAQQQLKDLRSLRRTTITAHTNKDQSPRTQLGSIDKV